MLQLGREILRRQNFSRHLGADLTALEPGEAEIVLDVDGNLLQQNGFVHGGVLAYLADNAITFAGGSVLGPEVLTQEYKLSFLRPAAGECLVARATVAYHSKRQAVCRCDIYAAAGTPCVTAHSTVRSLSSRYGGPLYQVKRADGRLLDIGVIAGGFADAAAQDRFCAGALCYINRIYDQSGKGNDLMQAPPGPFYPGPDKGAFDTQPIADMAPITIGAGHKAYGVYIIPGMGFRNNNARDLPIDDEPAGIHAVVDGQHFSNGCCFNYGNASTNGLAVGTGTMESVYFGTSTGWGSGTFIWNVTRRSPFALATNSVGSIGSSCLPSTQI